MIENRTSLTTFTDTSEEAPEQAPSPPSRIVPRSVRRQVEDRPRRAIMDGVYAPGEHLSDRVLCEQLGVSRSIVREAVRLLEAEGFVTVKPHRGPFVAFVSAREAAQIYELRAVLEGLAGAGFAVRASERERDELRAVYEALAASDPDAGRRALLDVKRRFYEVLLRGCDNPCAAHMLEQILDRNTQLRATSLSAPDRLPDTIREIRRIVEAIEARDADAARRACSDHVEAAARVALRVLPDFEGRPDTAGDDARGA